MPSILDVARRAEVAIGTVSRVLNDGDHVADETRKRILRAIKDLGYRPNPYARALRTSRTHFVALALPELNNPFYASIAEGVQRELERAEYSVVLCGPSISTGAKSQYLQLLSNRHVDGLIVASNHYLCESSLNKLLMKFGRDGHPIVLLGGMPRTKTINFDCISTDTSTGIKEGIHHLIRLGHKKIAYFGPPSGVAENRIQTFRAVLSNMKIGVNPAFVFQTEPTLENGFMLAERVLRLKSRPTAIVAVNDLVAIGALIAFQERGVPVPSSMSIIGVDDLSLASMIRPKLTTVSQPKEELGRLAAKRLLGRLDGRIRAFETISLSSELVIRDSTAPPHSS